MTGNEKDDEDVKTLGEALQAAEVAEAALAATTKELAEARAREAGLRGALGECLSVMPDTGFYERARTRVRLALTPAASAGAGEEAVSDSLDHLGRRR